MTWNEDRERLIAAAELGDATPLIAADLLVAARKRAFEAEHKAQQLQTELATLRAAHTWIKTSERLPVLHTSVLGVDGYGEVAHVRHCSDIWVYDNSDNRAAGEVTYWMPLPEPPK